MISPLQAGEAIRSTSDQRNSHGRPNLLALADGDAEGACLHARRREDDTRPAVLMAALREITG